MSSLSSRLPLKRILQPRRLFSTATLLANKPGTPAISKMVKVTLNGTTLAESTDTIVVEGNHYFPPASIKKEYFKDSDTHTICPWKGQASYYTLSIPDVPAVPDAAWYYPECKEKAKNIEGYVAFYKNKVEITE
ncbi:hypothetical protein NMY22_g16316 [Coprinellus aureogranulatus]|nr:hypothetical protein NMY22_g16316 [Coprinellus aureogranulatus]